MFRAPGQSGHAGSSSEKDRVYVHFFDLKSSLDRWYNRLTRLAHDRGGGMQVGDLVRSLKSESGMLGIIVGWHRANPSPSPIVHWNDGRTNWVMPHLVKVIS